jgi:hypothetical protein
MMISSNEGFERWLAEGRRAQRADVVLGIEEQARVFGECLLHGTATLTRSRLRMGDREVAGYMFPMYQPWYKAAPLGMLLDIEISIDGEIAPRESIYYMLKGGQRIRALDAPSIRDIGWNIVEPLSVFIADAKAIDKESCKLEVRLAERVAEYYEFPLDMLIASASVNASIA